MTIEQFFFKFRGFTPVPLVLIVLIFAQPTGNSFLLGCALMVVGELIRIWGVSYAGGATRTRNVGAHQLVTNGPFAHLRNPLYLGNMFMYTGAAVIANVWIPYLILFTWIFFGIQYYFIIKLEEEKLKELFGQTYLDYCQRVPRILPQLKAAPSENPVKPDLPGALRSEKSTFISFASILILLFLKMKFFL
ncbi:MAG: hypothetical protein Kow0037_19260 [Calditrichia bacterium]